MEKLNAQILIVDDNPENLRVLGKVLKEEGFIVRFANNGKQAIDSVKEQLPDLILLDIHMPEMDGYQVCETIRKDYKQEVIPILFISALDDSFNKLKAFSLGASDYISKPFNIEEVKARVNVQLGLKQSLEEIARLRSENQELSNRIKNLEDAKK